MQVVAVLLFAFALFATIAVEIGTRFGLALSLLAAAATMLLASFGCHLAEKHYDPTNSPDDATRREWRFAGHLIGRSGIIAFLAFLTLVSKLYWVGCTLSILAFVWVVFQTIVEHRAAAR